MGTIKKNYFYNVLVNVLNTILPLVSFPYISRVLMPDGLGKAQFMISFSQYFAVIAALGIPLYGIREIAKVAHDRSARSKTFSEIFAINFLSSGFLSIIYLIVIFNLQPFSLESIAYLVVGMLVFFGFLNIDWYYSGLEKFKLIAIRSATVRILSLVALFVFVKTKDDLVVYLVITVFSFLAVYVWNVFLLRDQVDFSLRRLELKRHMKPILLNFSVLFAISVYTVLDTVLLGMLAGDTSVGYYSAAVRVSKMVIPLVTALGVVLLPRLSRAMDSDNRSEIQYLAERSFWYIEILAIPAFIGLFIFSEEFIYVLSGNAFGGAVLPMQILSPLVLMIAMAHFFAFQLLIPAKQERWYLIAVTIGAVSCLSLNMILVPKYHAVGAAVANLTTEAIITVLSYIFVRRLFSIQLDWRKFVLKVVYVGVLFGTVAAFCRFLSAQAFFVLTLGVPLCVMSYFCVVYFVEKDAYLKTLLLLQRQYWFGKRK